MDHEHFPEPAQSKIRKANFTVRSFSEILILEIIFNARDIDNGISVYFPRRPGVKFDGGASLSLLPAREILRRRKLEKKERTGKGRRREGEGGGIL